MEVKDIPWLRPLITGKLQEVRQQYLWLANLLAKIDGTEPEPPPTLARNQPQQLEIDIDKVGVTEANDMIAKAIQNHQLRTPVIAGISQVRKRRTKNGTLLHQVQDIIASAEEGLDSTAITKMHIYRNLGMRRITDQKFNATRPGITSTLTVLTREGKIQRTKKGKIYIYTARELPLRHLDPPNGG